MKRARDEPVARMGAHSGSSIWGKNLVGLHTDLSVPVSEYLNRLACQSGFRACFQTAWHQVYALDQCTRTLWVVRPDGVHEQLSLTLYIQYFEWLAPQLQQREPELCKRSGKINWPEWVTSAATLMDFQTYCATHHPESAHLTLVLRSPPAELVPGFVEGVSNWVCQHWLEQSFHAGPAPPSPSRRREVLRALGLGSTDIYRKTIFATNPDSRGLYTSDTSGHPDFLAQQWELQVEVNQMLLELDDSVSIDVIRSHLLEVVPLLESKYPIRCMDGASHNKYVRRCIMVVAAQPSVDQMRATLWHEPVLGVPRDFDPVEAARARDAAPVQPACGSAATCIVADAGMVGKLELLEIRLHHYLTCYSKLDFPCTHEAHVFFSKERIEWRKGPWAGRRVNIPDCCFRVTNAGFGIQGAIFVHL